MLETIFMQLLIPLVLTGAGSYFSFKWGRKKTKEEMKQEKIETSSMIIELVNKQLEKAYTRIEKLEEETLQQKIRISLLEGTIDNKRLVIRAAYNCDYVTNIHSCPVLKKEMELDDGETNKTQVKNEIDTE